MNDIDYELLYIIIIFENLSKNQDFNLSCHARKINNFRIQ